MSVRHGHKEWVKKGKMNVFVIRVFTGSGASVTYHSANEWLLYETDMRYITCTVRQHELWLYGHVERLPEVDSTHRFASERIERERPQLIWHDWNRKADPASRSSIRKEPVWRLTPCPRGCRRKWTRRRIPSVCPIWLIDWRIYLAWFRVKYNEHDCQGSECLDSFI